MAPTGSTARSPLSLYFNITSRCNSRCKFCAAGIPNLKNCSEISAEYILQIFEHYNLGPNDDVVINGGEPTLYRDLDVVIHEASVRGAEVILFTNGRLLCHFNKAKDWLGAGVYVVSIPLHGSRAVTHDMLTKRSGSFDQTIIGIRNAMALRSEIGFPKKVELKVLAVRESLNEWPEIINLIAKKIGNPDVLVMSGLNMWSSAVKTYQFFVPTIEQMREMVNVSLQNAVSQRMPVKLWAIPLCLLSPENQQTVIEQTHQNKSPSRRRLIYYDPNYLDGIEYPDDEFTPYKDIEPICRGCHLAETCGPGRVFFQQLLAASD